MPLKLEWQALHIHMLGHPQRNVWRALLTSIISIHNLNVNENKWILYWNTKYHMCLYVSNRFLGCQSSWHWGLLAVWPAGNYSPLSTPFMCSFWPKQCLYIVSTPQLVNSPFLFIFCQNTIFFIILHVSYIKLYREICRLWISVTLREGMLSWKLYLVI